MRLSGVLAAVVAVLRRPADLLPLYLLGAAIPVIVRAVVFIGVAVGAGYLLLANRVSRTPQELATHWESVPDPEADPAAFETWLSDLVAIVSDLVTLPLVLIVGGTLVASLLLAVLTRAIVTAGQLGACHGRLTGERGLVAGIAGVRQYAGRMLGLLVLEIGLWIVLLLAIGMPTTIAAAAAGMAHPVLGVLVGLLGVLVGVISVAVLRAMFAFAPVAVVVDDVGIVDSLRATIGFVRTDPVGAGFYYAFALGSLLALSTVAGVLTLVGVTMVFSLVTAVIVFPLLDLLKTALYARYRDSLYPPHQPSRRLRRQFRDGLKRGWEEMVAFVRATPGTHAVVSVLAVGSFLAGWGLVGPLTGEVDAAISERIDGLIPPTAALEFFGNNWFVALTTAFGGLALAVPAVVSVLFNGLVIGATARFEVEPLELLAFVIPHGIFEIPAILIATTAGIWLGVAWWRTLRGRHTRRAFADVLERMFWVLVGVGILLAIAGFIEGFISPFYWQPFL